MTAEQFRPKFTTSQEAQEEKREERASYFGDNVRTVEQNKPPTGPSRPLTRAMKPVEPTPLPIALSKRQQRQLKKS